MRPKPRSRMPGTARSISAIGDEHELAVGVLPLLAAELERVAARRAARVGHEHDERPEVRLDAGRSGAGAASRSIESNT